jgi:predicted amidophosphoribosyltransferase
MELQAAGFKETDYVPVSIADSERLITRVREYPCPECGDYAPFNKLFVVKQSRKERAEIMDQAREHIRRYLANALGDYMLHHDLIAFEERPSDRYSVPVVETRAIVGIVAPKHVATFEERVAERQFDIAERLAIKAAQSVDNWGSYYGQRTVDKSQARQLIMGALRELKESYGRK